MTELYLLPFVT